MHAQHFVRKLGGVTLRIISQFKKTKKLIGYVSLIYVRVLYCICQFEILLHYKL